MSKQIPELNLLYLDEDRNKFIGNKIADARKQKGYKACELADAIGIGKDQYSKIENGKTTCTIDNLFVLAQYLNLDINYLFYGKESFFYKKEASELLDSLNDEQLERAKLILQAAFGSLSN